MMTTTAQLIADTFEILEAIPRVYADTPQGKKQAARLQTKLAAYFRHLRKSFPVVKTVVVAQKHPIRASLFRFMGDAGIPLEEAARGGLEKELVLLYQKWVGGERGPLEAVLKESIEQSGRDGFKGGLGGWIDKYKLKPPPAGLDALVPKALVKWTGEHAATLVKGIDEATAKQLAGVIARGMEEQRGIPGMTRDIRKWADESLVEMSKSRAENIARTETNTAYSKGNNDAAGAVGSQTKEWIKKSDYDCDDCDANADAGRIPFNEDFPSGHSHTPAHNRCECDVAYYGATRLSTEKAIAA